MCFVNFVLVADFGTFLRFDNQSIHGDNLKSLDFVEPHMEDSVFLVLLEPYGRELVALRYYQLPTSIRRNTDSALPLVQ